MAPVWLFNKGLKLLIWSALGLAAFFVFTVFYNEYDF